jgi:hypothetical protein
VRGLLAVSYRTGRPVISRLPGGVLGHICKRIVKLLLIHNICCQKANNFFVEYVVCDNIPPDYWLKKRLEINLWAPQK